MLIAILLCWVHLSVHAQQGALLVSELLFQPASGEAEYVELYNRGDTAVDLADWHIVRWIGDSLGRHYPLPAHRLEAHSYVVLSRDAASVLRCFDVHYPDRLLTCNLPPYPNAGGSVVLALADSTVVDRFDYSPSMHSRLLRDKAGVSLERRSFDRPSDEPSNWFSASSTAGYGTPGYTNSQSSEWLAAETDFVFSSTLLSPDGDGYQDLLELGYRLDDGGLAARIEVYDVRGRRVRRLLDNGLLGTHGSLEWDGRSDDGQLSPPGQYIVQIVLFDTRGTRQTIRRTVALLSR